MVPFQRRRRHWKHVLRVCGSLILGWVAMRNGSGTRTLRVVAPAGDLAFERVGGIICNRVRSTVPSLSIVFGKSNEGVG